MRRNISICAQLRASCGYKEHSHFSSMLSCADPTDIEKMLKSKGIAATSGALSMPARMPMHSSKRRSVPNIMAGNFLRSTVGERRLSGGHFRPAENKSLHHAPQVV